MAEDGAEVFPSSENHDRSSHQVPSKNADSSDKNTTVEGESKASCKEDNEKAVKAASKPLVDETDSMKTSVDSKQENVDKDRKPHPYAVLLSSYEEHMDFLLHSYGNQKFGTTSIIEERNIAVGGNKVEAFGKRSFLQQCLENSTTPQEVYEAKCLRLWNAVLKEYRTIKLQQMTTMEMLNTSHITLTKWVREVFPEERRVQLFEAIFFDGDTIKIGKKDKEGCLNLRNEKEEICTFQICTKSHKFVVFPTEGTLQPCGDSKIIVLRLTDSRIRETIELIVDGCAREMAVDIAKMDSFKLGIEVESPNRKEVTIIYSIRTNMPTVKEGQMTRPIDAPLEKPDSTCAEVKSPSMMKEDQELKESRVVPLTGRKTSSSKELDPPPTEEKSSSKMKEKQDLEELAYNGRKPRQICRYELDTKYSE